MLFILGALGAAPAVIASVPPKVTPDHPSLTGRLLVASQGMGDPRFRQTVILMVRHTKDGAFGVTINRPLGERPFADLLAALGDKDASVAGKVELFSGGPVQPEIAFVVHSTEYARAETISVNVHISATSTIEIVRDIAHKKGPRKALVAFGYAGWGPGQLEAEMNRQDWLTAPADEKLVFDASRERLWDEAVARRLRDL
jgi:putative transcriptional regulator